MDLQQTRPGWQHRRGRELDRCLAPGPGHSRRRLRFASGSLCVVALAVGLPGFAHAAQQATVRHGHPFTVVLANSLPPPTAPSPAAPAAELPEVASGAPPVPVGISGTGNDNGTSTGVAVAQQAPPGDLSTPAGAGAVVASFALPGTGPRHLAQLFWSALAAVSLGGALMVARRRRTA